MSGLKAEQFHVKNMENTTFPFLVLLMASRNPVENRLRLVVYPINPLFNKL